MCVSPDFLKKWFILILLYLILLNVVYHNCSHFLLTDDDYDCNGQLCKSFKVKFLPGESRATEEIRILTDTEMECNEIVTVHINSSDHHFKRVEPYTANIIIMDVETGKSLTLYAFYYNKMIL